MQKINMKGSANLTALAGAIIMFIILAIVAAVGLDIISDLQTSYGSTTAEYLALENATEGISNITERFGLLGTVLIFGMIIAVVIGYLAIQAGR